ncbi:MAG: hypothetical protein V3R66_04150 [Rhodospirillales bacterium]
MAAVIILIAPAWASNTPEAEGLAADAYGYYEQAAKTPNPAARLELLEKAQANFEAIVRDHPESDLAKQIMGGEKAGGISRKDLSQAIRRTRAAKVKSEKKAQTERCFASPTPACLAEQALDTTRAIEEPADHAMALAVVAEAKAKTGNIAEALEITGYIASVKDRAKSLFHIALAQLRNGDIQDALESARAIRRPVIFRVLTLGHIAAAQAEAGDMEAARKTIAESLGFARGSEDVEERSRALGALAGTEAKAGELSDEALRTYGESLETGRGIKNALRLAVFYRDIATEQAEAGFISEAADTFTRAYNASHGFVGDAAIRDAILSDHAESLALNGDIVGALKTVRRIQGKDNTKALVMVIIAGAQAEKGDIAGALETAHSIERSVIRAMGLSRIASIQADAGDISGARETLSGAVGFEAGGKKASALTSIAIATAQFRTGDSAGAAETTSQLLKEARETEDELSRIGYLTFIVRSQADAGDIKGAMKTALSIERPVFRANALALIAIHLAGVKAMESTP